MTKKFKLPPDGIRPLAAGHGRCFATDMIVVRGKPVGFMYREEPDNQHDSGWRFMSGLEDQDYMDEPDNLGIYDVNTIANYDPTIIALLDSPVGSVFERTPGTRNFRPVDDWRPPGD